MQGVALEASPRKSDLRTRLPDVPPDLRGTVSGKHLGEFSVFRRVRSELLRPLLGLLDPILDLLFLLIDSRDEIGGALRAVRELS